MAHNQPFDNLQVVNILSMYIYIINMEIPVGE